MENKIIKKLILLLGAIIFSFVLMTNTALAFTPTPDCIISNFKANRSTSITVSSGNPVTLSWNTIDCASVKLSGNNINTNVAPNGYLSINPTASSNYSISATTIYGYPIQYQTVEVSVIPITNKVNTSVSTTANSVSSNTYYPTQSVATVKKSTTSKSTTNVSNTSTSNTNDANSGNVLGASAYNSGITALSLRGSGGFMPSSIWQWLLVIILILIIIVISRSLVKKPSPGDHDTHVAHVH
jgi:hypothetical protein